MFVPKLIPIDQWVGRQLYLANFHRRRSLDETCPVKRAWRWRLASNAELRALR